jgi:3-oxoacyl-[acyl-carrier-protein] synthase-3
VVPAGIQAIATMMPTGLRTNAFWPDRRSRAAQVAGTTMLHSPRRAFDIEFRARLSDPFLGARQRRVTVEGESSLDMGRAAAVAVLDAAGLDPADVDCLISVSMFPDRVGSGDAAFLARDLGLSGGAFNVEATCAGSMRALLVACGLVGSGMCRRVLVVTTALLTRALGATGPDAVACGDASAAMVVGPVPAGYGILGAHSMHTGMTCGTWLLDAVPDGETGQRIRLRTAPSIGHVLRTSAEPALTGTVTAALQAARVTVDDISFFVFHNGTAWHCAGSVRALGIDPDRTLDTFPRYGNIGPAIMPVTAHTAALEHRIRGGDLVLLYGFGGQAEAIAAVVRWGDVALGPPAAPPVHIDWMPVRRAEVSP